MTSQQHFDHGSEAPPYPSSTDTSTIYSMPLSETATVTNKRELELLAGTYEDTPSYFAPYRPHRRANAGTAYNYDKKQNEDYDDEMTMISQDEVAMIMDRPISNYDRLSQFFVVSKLLQNTMYVFADKESFNSFKHQRKMAKKDMANFVNRPALSSHSDDTVSADSGEGRDPLNQQCSLNAKPLLEIAVPYLSSMRQNTPFMVFRKYRETIGNNADEKYDFCTVLKKSLEYCKRYVFRFQLEDGPAFTVLAFQNDYRPFTDFIYKGTRFRVFGTSRKMYLSYYNPELKLCILDHDQPSLAEDLVEKQNKTSKASLKGKANVENLSPSKNNPIIQQIINDDGSYLGRNTVPRDMPSFGKFVDSCTYTKSKPRLPKRFSEAGEVAVYQARCEGVASDATLPNLADLDSLVLTTIFLALRETNIRSTVKGDDIRGISTTSSLS